uniref:C-type lectin domain-containing protein n=1 Tax=Calidris pygmaea TaxID=425635 RepID=A0A8C3K5W9_9CHAR
HLSVLLVNLSCTCRGVSRLVSSLLCLTLLLHQTGLNHLSFLGCAGDKVASWWLTVVLTCLSEDEGCILCPMNWMSHGTKCYWVSHELSRWNSSREDCVNQGGQLMMPEDQKELDFINRNLQKPTRYFWIGLFFEKGWTWVNSSHLDPSRFQLNPQAEGRSCGVIREGRISTINCSAALQWICQKEATQL